ncbi:MAG: hypothetical protein ABIT05_09295 [Chitinophagaceae bacterium]
MKEEQQDIYKKIDDLLWTERDPIGVNDCEEARDEYTSYALQIWGLKHHQADNETIAKRLFEIETVMMELPGNMERCKELAKKILAI